MTAPDIGRRTLDVNRVAVKNVSSQYYEAAAAIARPRHFPSPVNDPEWIRSAVDWFVESHTAMEVGPGRGEFAGAVIKQTGELERYYIIDMSQRMLDLVKKRISTIETEVETIPICADVDSDPLLDIPDSSVDRIIMINAFQDIEPMAALGAFRRILNPNGLFRANVLSREVREKFASKEDFFDVESGCFYLTRHPAVENEGEIEPIGYITGNSGEEIPFYRSLKSYYRPELDEIFRDCGFEIISTTPVIISRKIWMNSVAAQYKEQNHTRRLELMEKFGGYPGSIDIIAKPLTG